MRIKKGIKVRIESTKHFTDQAEARSYAINVLGTGVTYLTIDDWYEEVEDPEPEPVPEPTPLTTPGYPKTITAEKVDHRKYPHHVRKKSRTSPTIFPLEMEEFVKNNLSLSNKDLAKKVNIQFDLDMDNKNISDYMRARNIKRKKVIYSDEPKFISKESERKYHVKPGPGKKFTPEVDKYLIEHADASNEEIAESLKRLFDVDTTPGSVGNRKSILKSAKPTKEKIDMRKTSKYPDEMKEFIRNRMETTTNPDLLNLINEKWDLGLTIEKLKGYMKHHQLKRKFIIRSPRRTSTELGKEPRVYSKKYTDEAVQFLRENINNFKNKELCEELETRFNIKTTPNNLNGVLSQKGIKRDIPPDMEPEIEDFILKSKIKDAYILKDKIIEKFDKNIETRKIINIMNKRPRLSGESVKEEVDRVEEQRIKKQRDPFDNEIDELDLDE